MVQAQRSRFIPALALGVAAYLFASRAFVSVAPTAPSSARGSVAVKSFKDDFDAWRSSLSKEEKELMAEQAEKVFDKKFLKTERAKEELPKEKKEAFSQVLGKFFDNEDYKKEGQSRIPDYDALKGKVAENAKEFNLRMQIVEIDRNADRKYDFASRKIREAQAKGEYYPNSSPRVEIQRMLSNTPELKEMVAAAVKETKKATEKAMEKIDDPNEDVKKALAAVDYSKFDGDSIDLWLNANDLEALQQSLFLEDRIKEDVMASEDEKMKKLAELIKEKPEKLRELTVGGGLKLIEMMMKAREEVKEGALWQRDFFRTQRDNSDGKITKADVLKELWTIIPKKLGGTLPPLDEELMAELAKKPAGHGFIHPWGTADKLYKSEAVDTFGARYLLGIFTTQDEARAAFEEWNKEYNQARANMKDEFEQYGKRESARVEQDTSARDRIMAVLDETRSKLNR